MLRPFVETVSSILLNLEQFIAQGKSLPIGERTGEEETQDTHSSHLVKL
jgi:hypothetical protein